MLVNIIIYIKHLNFDLNEIYLYNLISVDCINNAKKKYCINL